MCHIPANKLFLPDFAALSACVSVKKCISEAMRGETQEKLMSQPV